LCHSREQKYDAELDLQLLVAAHPEILAGDQMTPTILDGGCSSGAR